MRPVLLAVLLLSATACQPSLALIPTPTVPLKGTVIVVVAEGGVLPTKPALRTPEPTATTNLLAIISTVAPFPTRTPGPPVTPSPTLAPPPTSTRRPTPTRMSGSFPTTPTPTRAPAPTRTPRPTEDPLDAEDTRIARETVGPTPIPEDDLEPNDSPDEATSWALEEDLIGMTIHALTDRDFFEIDVFEPDTLLTVTLTGPTITRYNLAIFSPTRGSVGRQRIDGSVVMRSNADVGDDLGLYTVEVRNAGAQLPSGPYSLRAALLAVPTRTPTP